jgi:nucleotide-binding universal stress UspA family protein
MFKHLIVPLDGSRLSEAALPVVIYLAQKLDAMVTLVHVIEKNPPEEIHGELHLSNAEQAESYLEDVQRRMFPPGIRVERHVHTTATADVPGSIAEHAREFESDLVVMCTHGRRGELRRLFFGDIAQRVVASNVTPVLLIRPAEGGSAAFLSGRPFLVPLDGTTLRERALPIAAGLASACKVDLNLLMVVPTLSTLSGVETASRFLLPATTQEMLALASKDAEDYMRKLLDGMPPHAGKVTAEIKRGDPAEVIITEARRLGVDMIVIGTEGKAGMEAFWASSVATKLSNRTHLAILLIPAHVPVAA